MVEGEFGVDVLFEEFVGVETEGEVVEMVGVGL